MGPTTPDTDTILRQFIQALEAGEHQHALTVLQQGLAQTPDDPQLNNFMGKFLLGAGHVDPGIEHLQRAATSPQATEEHILDLARAPFPPVRQEDAETACRNALKLHPESPEFWKRLAQTLRNLHRDEDARDAYQEVLALAGPNFGLLYNLANTELDLGAHAAAEDHYAQALQCDPDHPDAHLHLGFCHLAQGHFAAGWPEMEWRLKAPAFAGLLLDTPRWNGEHIEGTIVIQGEQGLGDNVQFIRYASLVAERASRVVMRCPPMLMRLMQSVDGIDEVVCWDDPPPPHDAHVQVMSLPLVFGTTLDTIPAEVPYICAPDDAVAAWAETIKALPGPRVAVTWSGNPDNPRDRLRTIPTDAMLDLIRATDASFICMNKERPQDVDAWPDNLHHFGDRFTDVADAAALLTHTDLVLTIDTLLAHLAGALGRETWVLLGPVAEWRYLEQGEDCPWYPDMRLLRRSQNVPWADFLQDVRNNLKDRLADV